MHTIRIHRVMNNLISLLHRTGFWHHEDRPTAGELAIQWFYCIYYLLFVIALTLGAISMKTLDKSVFTASASIAAAVLAVKLSALIWKQKEILVLVNRVGVFSMRHSESFTFCTNKLESFTKFVVVFLSITFVACTFTGIVVPLIGNERNLLFKIAFPLDWRNNAVAFSIANCFVVTESFLTIVPIIYSVIIWYLMICCSLRYKVLSTQIKRLGQVVKQQKATPSKKEVQRIFVEDLKVVIVAHNQLRGLTDDLHSFSSNLFFIQFCTSGISICASTYCLASNVSKNLVERMIFLYELFYNISDLFMITYFGNEIKLSSYSLLYSLFESQWIEQPQLTNKYVIIFGEFLKQPHELLIGKMYPLTLETFTKVLNSAYTMFNILKA